LYKWYPRYAEPSKNWTLHMYRKSFIPIPKNMLLKDLKTWVSLPETFDACVTKFLLFQIG
jgi:hypothetical protein